MASNRQGAGNHGRLSHVNGAMYFPQYAFNTYQTWWDYRPQQIERDLDAAATLGVDNLRVFLSYEFWKEGAEDDAPGNPHIARFNHFLDACGERGITVLPVLFESIGAEPSIDTLRNTNANTAFAVKSPSLHRQIALRSWSGYFGSPAHFTRRMTNEVAGDDRVIAIEVMNEPGVTDGAPKRIDFVREMLSIVREADPDRYLTVGCKEARNNLQYRDPSLDIFQYHHNLPVNAGHFHEIRQSARELADEHGVPLWLTEWQRYRREPPSRFLPHYQNMAPDIHDALESGDLDGAHFWGLMLKPAYIKKPREKGRVNGLFHPDGTVFSRADAEAIAGRELPDLRERCEYPQWMEECRFPFPNAAEVQRA